MKRPDWALYAAMCLMVAGGSYAQVSSSRIPARADQVLREMSEYLASAEEFGFRADITYDAETANGRKWQYGGTSHIALRRPNQLHVEFDGDERRRSVVIDGRTFSFHDRVNGVYATTDVPSPIDAAIDHVFELYGFSVPIADLVYSNPHRTLIENVQSGFVVGRHTVDGAPCHHLAFSQETIDWQIWIEDGPRPVPRKLVITYKTEPGSPQYVARLSEWDFAPRFSDHYFEFDPPPGAAEMEFLSVDTIPEEQGGEER